VEAVDRALVGGAGARLLAHLHHVLSCPSMLTCLLRIPLAPGRPIASLVSRVRVCGSWV
jgi:hypothetical protein